MFDIRILSTEPKLGCQHAVDGEGDLPNGPHPLPHGLSALHSRDRELRLHHGEH